MTEIIRASFGNLLSLVEMGRNFFTEAGWGDVAEWKDEEGCNALVHMLQSGQLIFIAKRGNEIVGMIGAIIYPLWFNASVKMAQEVFWYMKPEERNGTGSLLLDALEKEAKAQGVHALSMLSVEKLPSLDDYYIRRGYRPSEKTFIKRL